MAAQLPTAVEAGVRLTFRSHLAAPPRTPLLPAAAAVVVVVVGPVEPQEVLVETAPQPTRAAPLTPRRSRPVWRGYSERWELVRLCLEPLEPPTAEVEGVTVAARARARMGQLDPRLALPGAEVEAREALLSPPTLDQTWCTARTLKGPRTGLGPQVFQTR